MEKALDNEVLVEISVFETQRWRTKFFSLILSLYSVLQIPPYFLFL